MKVIMAGDRVGDFFKENLILLVSLLVVLVISLFFPEFYGVLWNYTMKLGFSNIILLLFILTMFVAISILVMYLLFFAFEYNYADKMDKIKEFALIASRIKGRYFDDQNKKEVLIKYTISILFEEILFRHLILGSMIRFNEIPAYEVLTIDYLGPNFIWILLSSLIFGFYHLHFSFEYKQKELALFFILGSFFLGLIAGIVFIYFGTLIAFVYHWIAAYFTYQMIAKHYNLKENKNGARISDISKIRKI